MLRFLLVLLVGVKADRSFVDSAQFITLKIRFISLTLV